MNSFKRNIIEGIKSFQPGLLPKGQKDYGFISRAADELDVFKKLKQGDQKRMVGLNRQMAETDKAMGKARNTNDFMRKSIK